MATQIYRYKLSDTIYEIIINFAKLHQYDERKDYKEAWQLLVEANEAVFTIEKERLSKLNYKGDVLDKMYKSGRYYFKEKPSQKKENKNSSTEYIKLSKTILQAIDRHIRLNNSPCKPSNGYNLFCIEQEETINREIERLSNLEKEVIMNKIKKSYKNRYFTIQKKKDI